MTTYNTGNPLGSTDKRDLFDNAENLDNAVNSDQSVWVDRFGKTRRTLSSIESTYNDALVNVGEYHAGITITSKNQLISDSDKFWRVSASTALPYTTTGTGMPEGGAFVSVGDAVLRQDLAAPGGAGLIGNGGIVFDSVSDMQTATWLKVGQKVRTLGYYTPGDGGGCDYEIVAAGAGTNDGGSFIDLSGSGLQARALFAGGVSVVQFGASPTQTAAVNTGSIQACIDYLHNLGGGEAFVPRGAYDISASTSTESWEGLDGSNSTISIAAGSSCLIMRDGVYLRGEGIGLSVFQMAANTGVDGIYVTASPNGYGLSKLSIDGGWDLAADVNSHGVFWVTKTIADEANTVFKDGILDDLEVRNVGSYGFGLQYGKFVGNRFYNLRVNSCGADALDVKDRVGSSDNFIEGMIISSFGTRSSLINQAGIDIRGEGWVINGPKILDFGRTDTPLVGVRMRPGSVTLGRNPAKSCVVSSFNIESINSTSKGVETFAEGSFIGPGFVLGCDVGVWVKDDQGAAAKDATVMGVVVDGGGIKGNAFASQSTNVMNTKWIGCSATNISTAFRPGGTGDQITTCSAGDGVTLPISLSGGPSNLTVTASPTLMKENRAVSFLSNGPIVIEDGQAKSIPVGSDGRGSLAMISAVSLGAAFPNGIFRFRSNATPQCNAIAMETLTGVAFTTGVLTGTTGVAGDFTISATEGSLYFENRTGKSQQVVLTFFGNR